MSGNPLDLSIRNDRDLETELEFIAMLTGCSEDMQEVSEILTPEDLYFPHLQDCFRYMLDLFRKNGKYVIEEVLSWLNDNDIIPSSSSETDTSLKMIKSAIKNVITFSSDGIMARARIIKRYSILRHARKAVESLMFADKDNAEGCIDTAVQELTSLSMKTDKVELKPVSDGIIDYITIKFSGKNENIIPTKWEILDKSLPMCRSDLVVIAARPSVGKSAFCGSLAVKFAFQGYKTALFSLEMSEEQIYNRLISCIGQIPQEILKRNLVKDSQYEEPLGVAANKLFSKPLSICDKSNVTVAEIKRQCQKTKADVIIIDYLQLLTPTTAKKNSSRTEDVSDMTRQLKIMAKELNALVIILSQLSRGVENRSAGSKPMLSDLRESGSIEQDANSVMILSLTNPNDKLHSDVLCDIAKSRDGVLQGIVFAFDRNMQTFRETDKKYEPPSSKGKDERF